MTAAGHKKPQVEGPESCDPLLKRSIQECGDEVGSASLTADPTTNTQDRLLNVGEIAELLGLAKGTIYHLASEGRIPCVRLSARCLKFRLSEVVAWIESKSQKEKK